VTESFRRIAVTDSNLNRTAEADPGYGQLFAILLRRRFWLLGVLVTVLSIATLKTLITKPTYESSMQLLIEPNYQGKRTQSGQQVNPENQFADSNIETDTATQLNLMRSSLLIQKAVDLLSSDYPTISVDQIQKSLILTQVEEDASQEKVGTKIIEAVYTDDDPLKTQVVLNAILKVYQDYNREQQKLRLSKGLAFIDEELPEVRQNVTQAEGALERFRKGQNLVDPEQQATITAETLRTVQQEQQAIRAQYQDAQAQYAALQQQLATRSSREALAASRLSQSSRYQALLNEIQKTELELEQQRLRFTDANPVVQRLLAQRQNQLALLQQEGGRVSGREAAAPKSGGEQLLKEGQLGGTDLQLASQLAEMQKQLSGLKARSESLAKTEQQLRAELNRFPSLMAEYNRLQPEVQTGRETLQKLLEARQDLSLEIARGGFDWQTVEPPQLGEKIGPDHKQNLLLGVVVGLFLGSIAAFLREAVDDAVHTSDALKQQCELPLLGMTPELPAVETSESIIKLPFRRPPAIASSTIHLIQWPPFRESLDLIYKNIQLLNSAPSFRSLIITSALAGEGKSTLALGLAISAARLHQRVLLVDADLRRPSLHKQLNLPNEQGLSTLLAGSHTAEPHQSSLRLSGSYIDVLTSGPTPIDPATLLSSPRMGQLMEAFEQNYDLVLLDAPPVLGTVDTILTASFCSGVMLVGRIGQVTQAELTQAKAMLCNLNVIGIVANGVKDSTYGYAPYREAVREVITPASNVGG